jgi:hypothetical protein
MTTDSNYCDNTPLSTRPERLTLLSITVGLTGFAVWLYVFG